MEKRISRIKSFLIHLWQTLRKYVCRKRLAKHKLSQGQMRAIHIMCSRRRKDTNVEIEHK